MPTANPGDILNAECVQFMSATKIIRDYNASFERYMETVGFDEVADAAELEM